MAYFGIDRSDLAGSSLGRLRHARPPVGRRFDPASGRSHLVRETRHPRASAPTVLLLHGWLASAGTNWIRSFDALAPRYSICAPDLHGHAGTSGTPHPPGQAGTSGTPHQAAHEGAAPTPDLSDHEADGFEIERCADDMAALVAEISPDRPVIVAGYSLGGMVAQALWRRHPERVAGLVLGATSAAPVPPSRGRWVVSGAMSLARRSTSTVGRLSLGPRRLGRSLAQRLAQDLTGDREDSPGVHWAAEELARHHWPTLFDAGRAIAEFDAREWIGDVDVPTSVLLTERDRVIPSAQQRSMADSIAHAHVERIDAGHLACVREDFGASLLASCRAVERELE